MTYCGTAKESLLAFATKINDSMTEMRLKIENALRLFINDREITDR